MSTDFPDAGTLFHPEEDDRQRVLEALYVARGLDFREYRVSTIGRRLARRLAAVGARDVDEYLSLLSSQPAELDHLIDFLTLKVTAFFRDAQAFEPLTRVVVPAVAEAARRERRAPEVWSAGCATGEEVYSLAMLLLDECERLGDCQSPRLLGTDIDLRALQTARAGAYRPAQLKGLPTELKEFWFVPGASEDGSWQVSAGLQSVTRFGFHDLADASADLPVSSGDGLFDLVSCRNVLIYMQRPLQLRVFETLDRHLRSGGYLFLGEAEALPESYNATYRALDRRSRIFVKVAPCTPSPARDTMHHSPLET